MEITIPYAPYPKQQEVHKSKVRFKIIAAGRRSGKTTLAINELIKWAIEHPFIPGKAIQRSWYICATYRQAEMIAWKEFLKYCPQELINSRNVNKLQVELINGHIVEFKGSEDPDKLRGVPLVFVVLDEYGTMKPEVWTDIVRAALVDAAGSALFIGTPSSDGSPHFYDLFNQGKGTDPAYKSWLFFTSENPHLPQEEIAEARRNLPPDVYKREFEADFSISAGLIYDNFRHSIHVVPHYEPDPSDFIVGSIDPGLHNPTAAILTAWNKDGEGVIFKEHYERDLLATENAKKIAEMSKPYRVGYWVIDRASTKRDPASGLTVFNKFKEVLSPPTGKTFCGGNSAPLITAANDPGSVWAGIDEVKKLFHVDAVTHRPKLFIASQLHYTLKEIGRYTRYKHKWAVEKNEEEKPRKLHDHSMDAMRNMVMTRPWLRANLGRIRNRFDRGFGY